jgi:hypothetical protein
VKEKLLRSLSVHDLGRVGGTSAINLTAFYALTSSFSLIRKTFSGGAVVVNIYFSFTNLMFLGLSHEYRFMALLQDDVQNILDVKNDPFFFVLLVVMLQKSR